MREIKFRVFDKKQNKFLKVRDFIDEARQFQFNGVAGYRAIGVLAYRISENGELHSQLFYAGNRFKIEQFTGLYDKHGTEIYEGDIVNFKGLFDIDKCENVEIVFDKGEFCIKWNGSICHNLLALNIDSIEVIGNIHENSELLK